MDEAVSFSFNILARLISSGGTLLLTVLVTRSLPLEETGKFFSAFTIAMGLTIILQAGQPLLLIRKLGECKASNQNHQEIFFRTTSNIVILNLIATFLIAVVSLCFLNLQDPIAWVWALLIPFACLAQFSSLLKGMGYTALGGLMEPSIVSMITSLIIIFWPQNDALHLWTIMAVVSWTIMMFSYLNLKDLLTYSGGSLKPSLRLCLEARHLWIITSLNYLAQWFGAIAAIFFLDEIDIAALNAIFRLLAPLQFISLTIDFYFAPRYALENGNELLRLRNLGRFFGLTLAMPYCLFLFIYSDLSIEFLYGDLGGRLGYLVKMLIVTGLIQIALGSNGMLLQMKSLDKHVLFGVLLRLLTYIAIILFITPIMCLAGLVFGFSISVLVQSAYNSRQVKNILKLH